MQGGGLQLKAIDEYVASVLSVCMRTHTLGILTASKFNEHMLYSGLLDLFKFSVLPGLSW